MLQDTLWPDLKSIDPRVEAFRPIQYLGSKWRIADAIVEVANDVVGRRVPVADVFAGSGVVARRFGLSRAVYASDIQEYSRVITAALLGGLPDIGPALDLISSAQRRSLAKAESPAIRSLLEVEGEAHSARHEGLNPVLGLVERSELLGNGDRQSGVVAEQVFRALEGLQRAPETAIFRYYGGVYFSFAQALVLDSLATEARRLSGQARDAALAAVLSTASELTGSVGGHFAQPTRLRDKSGKIKPQAIRTLGVLRRRDAAASFERWLRRYASIAPSTSPHVVRRLDYIDAINRLPPEVGLVYADPPYTRDHYSRFYHVLETIALGDEPGVTMVRAGGGSDAPSRGAYRLDRHQSPFSIKSRAPDAFADLFASVASRGIPIIVSYSPATYGTIARPVSRVVSIDTLVEKASGAYRNVQTVIPGHVAHSKFNRKEVNAQIDHGAETLVVCVDPR